MTITMNRDGNPHTNDVAATFDAGPTVTLEFRFNVKPAAAMACAMQWFAHAPYGATVAMNARGGVPRVTFGGFYRRGDARDFAEHVITGTAHMVGDDAVMVTAYV